MLNILKALRVTARVTVNRTIGTRVIIKLVDSELAVWSATKFEFFFRPHEGSAFHICSGKLEIHMMNMLLSVTFITWGKTSVSLLAFFTVYLPIARFRQTCQTSPLLNLKLFSSEI